MSSVSRRDFNKSLAGGLLGLSILGPRAISLERPAGQSPRPGQPNFVFVCSDQHSAKYAGFAGHPFVKTPNLDRIARKGITFTAAYCSSPLCVPGRSGLMTGMYPSDVNSFCNSTVYDGSHPTWGKRLREAGYHCWAVGKQDMNPAIDMGFVEAGVDHGHAKKPDIMSLFRSPVGFRLGEREGIDGKIRDENEGKRDRDNFDRDERDTQTALRFIRTESTRLGKPWVAFVGLREPHPPWIASKEYFENYLPLVRAPEVTVEELEALPLPYQVMRNFKRISTPIPEDRIRRAIAAYLGMVSELDGHIGQLYASLEETGQIDNTYFIYVSDHGESLGDHGMWLKNNLYEGPANIPLVVSGPGLPQGRVIDTPVSHLDLVATMLEWAGMQVPRELRGSSLVPLVSGKGGGPEFVYAESHSEGNPTGSFMIRKGCWKLLHFSYYGDWLFNLKEDPGERHNRAGDPAAQETLLELRSILRKQVDPEEVTQRAFVAQKKVLDGFVGSRNEEQLFELFRSRMGDMQARVIAKSLKR